MKERSLSGASMHCQPDLWHGVTTRGGCRGGAAVRLGEVTVRLCVQRWKGLVWFVCLCDLTSPSCTELLAASEPEISANGQNVPRNPKCHLHWKLLSWSACIKVILPCSHVSKQSIFCRREAYKNVTVSQMLRSGSQFSKIPDDKTHLHIWNLARNSFAVQHNSCALEETPSSWRSSPECLKMSRCCEASAQDLNQLQASSIWCTCDKSPRLHSWSHLPKIWKKSWSLFSAD